MTDLTTHSCFSVFQLFILDADYTCEQRTAKPKSTVLIMGDQINRGIASLAEKTPDDTRILFIELATKFSDKQWHKQKVHLLLSALKHFAQELREEGFEVDYRIAKILVKE